MAKILDAASLNSELLACEDKQYLLTPLFLIIVERLLISCVAINSF
jgi:hypothetical protein